MTLIDRFTWNRIKVYIHLSLGLYSSTLPHPSLSPSSVCDERRDCIYDGSDEKYCDSGPGGAPAWAWAVTVTVGAIFAPICSVVTVARLRKFSASCTT